MGTFEVFVFLTHCFVPSAIDIGGSIRVVPLQGIGARDVADLMDAFLTEVLGQPPQPSDQRERMLAGGREHGASAVIEIGDVVADNPQAAIQSTEAAVMLVRDVLAFRQYVRGTVSGFMSMRTDTSPVELYSALRPPAVVRKVYNLPMFESEGEIQTQLYGKAKSDPALRAYLSLFADTVAFADTMTTDIELETQVLKTWALLETLADQEKGSKKQKVKALFDRYSVSTHPNFHNERGKDLIDVAYKWRNIIAHCGSCKAATTPDDVAFCEQFGPYLDEMLRELRSVCQALISQYALALPDR